MFLGGVIKLNKRGYALIGLLVLTLIYFHYSYNRSTKKYKEISLLSLLQTAIIAAEVGGEIVVSVKNDLEIKSKGQTKEGMEDSVTTADFLSHCAMKHIITGNFPSVTLISEEKDTLCKSGKEYVGVVDRPIDISNEIVKAEDVTIWIDPLDATKEYTEKLYQFVTTMICVAIKGQPVIGVIHNPFNKSTSWAVVGHGHSSNLQPMMQRMKNDKIKVIISRSHSGIIQEVLNKKFDDLEIVIAAGAGYKALEVAQNKVDAYLHMTAIKKWDVCAGNAILNALGGKMTTKHGKLLTYYNNSDFVNNDGLIATLINHDLFINKF